MKLSSRHDIEAPIDFVFARAADFEEHMRQAMRRGIAVSRTDSLPGIAVGMCWNVRFDWRGKRRQLNGRLSLYQPPERFCVESVSGGIDSLFEIELIALSPGRTRLRAGLEMRPRSMPARLLIQSLKLGKGRLSNGFARRVAAFAEETEVRYKGPAASFAPR